MKKGILTIAISVLAVLGIMAAAAGCSSGSKTASAADGQTATVKKGTVSISVTGTGNLAYSHTEDLAFEIAGTVNQVVVETGESVTEGQELARLDTSVWDKQIRKLQNDLKMAKQNLIDREVAVNTKEFAVRQAELAIQSADDAVSEIPAVKTVQDRVDNAEIALKTAKASYGSNPNYTSQQIDAIQTELVQAQKDLQEVLRGAGLSLTTDVALQIATSQLKVDETRMNLKNAQKAVSDAQSAVEDTKEAVVDAQDALDEANSQSPIVTAPFDGFITRVNVSGGDDIQKGTVAMQIADPNQFEANIMVTEQDIFSVKVGGDASVTIDAASGITFPAKITAIAPLATVQQGVVNYAVTVEITSLTPTSAGSVTGGQLSSGAREGFEAAGLPGGALPDSIEDLPKEIRDRLAAAGIKDLKGILALAGGTSSPASRSANVASGITLKDGLTATVNIVVQQKTGVLLVPSKAITRQGTEYSVQVVNGENSEKRTVKTGLADSKNTEIVEGLNEGETLVMPAASSASSRPSGMSGFGMLGGD